MLEHAPWKVISYAILARIRVGVVLKVRDAAFGPICVVRY